MKKTANIIIFTILTLGLCCIYTGSIAQKGENKPTILRDAGNYSANHDVLAVVALRGTAYKAEYDQFMIRLGDKLDSLGIPYKLFQEFDQKQGTVLGYFIENDMNGPMNANELVALLPHIARRYRSEYEKK